MDSYDAGDIPKYWQTLNMTGNSYATVEVQDNGSYAYSGTMSLKMYNSGATAGSLLAILPKNNIGFTNHEIKLWARSNGADIIVGIMSNPTDTSTFVSIDTIRGLHLHTRSILYL